VIISCVKKIFKRILGKITNWIEAPGDLYLNERYKYNRGSSIFPARNAHMLDIHPQVSLHDVLFNVWAPITIEAGVGIAHQVMFLTGGHKIDEFGAKSEVIPRGPIVVKKNAWIGSRAIILGNVTIGRGSIIGAGSVVTKSVPDYEMWAGNPARLIRKLR
jgi:acetyltransferase-like isoleucine patch superfamily enzyme